MSVVLKNPKIVAFDFDGTLTRQESFFQFLWFISSPWQFAWRFFRCLPTLWRYYRKRISNHEAKAAVIRHFFSGYSVSRLEVQAAEFAQRHIPSTLRPEAIARLHRHQSQGHVCVLVSATLAVYLRPWAQHVGFDDVLATELGSDGHHYDGSMSTPNCAGEEKARRIRERFGVERIYAAYGDTEWDAQMLAMAEHAHMKLWS